MPFHAIKFATLVIGIPIVMYYPEYIPFMVQINIVEAACQDMVNKFYKEAAFGAVVAAGAPMLAMTKLIAVSWGVAYMLWHVGFLRRINFHGAPGIIQNVIPFTLLCVAPDNIGALVWAIGRTVAILQHQCEGLATAIA